MVEAPAITLDALSAKLDQLLTLGQRDAPRFLSVDDAATYSSLSAESIRRLLSTGKLTALRPVRGRVVIDRQELDSWILSSTKCPRSGRGRR